MQKSNGTNSNVEGINRQLDRYDNLVQGWRTKEKGVKLEDIKTVERSISRKLLGMLRSQSGDKKKLEARFNHIRGKLEQTQAVNVIDPSVFLKLNSKQNSSVQNGSPNKSSYRSQVK